MKVMKVAVLGGVLLLASAVHAGAAAAAAAPGAELTLSVTAQGSDTPATARLTCDPDGGTHPAPKAACDALRAVDGRPELLTPAPGTVCVGLYDPRTVQITGHWQGREVSYEATFGNECHLRAATGPIFAF
jgi:Subtilisin inhibitor-like.